MDTTEANGQEPQLEESLGHRAVHALSNGVHKLLECGEGKDGLAGEAPDPATFGLGKHITVELSELRADVTAQSARDAQAELEATQDLVTVVLLKPHTHDGKKLDAGAEITTYQQQARWLVLMRVAEVKTETTNKE